ncbi:SulP family inorganic anion transporter [Amylibacter sp. SFDW26]|uniref:SulP family inorganic anion transporter n=1 Tax=Amylibacter sp. SFDW26 TaxID=2652722 RepID=UPI0012615504|nr:SulP family inorganic anion transporter [Amylibacter sp. SFDW26]KAB7610053.1 SulP family inorganic anion transporter [Amylibacter sp. SFDW26]
MRIETIFPAYSWMTKMNGKTVSADAYAGFTNAAIVLPQGVAFATIAGLPPEYGLYTAMITAVVAALFGSSMIMISGPTTAISAVLFATLNGIAEPGTAKYIELALIMTVLVGVFQVVAGLARLGGLVSFVSHSVMTAFTASAALLIGVSQLAGATGVEVERGGNIIERLTRLSEHFVDVNIYAVTISMSTLGLAVFCQKYLPKLPGFMIALVAGSGLAWYLDAAAHGVSMVGALPSTLPQFTPPTGIFSELSQLAPGAAAIALVGLLEAISIGRAFAIRRKEPFDSNQEMVGQGLSNLFGGMFQCYAGSGSFTRSGVNATAGAMTPLSGLFASAILALMLLFIGPLVAHIPTPAMAGLILFVAWRLIDVNEVKHIITSSRPETVILVLTLAAGLFIELDFAIYIGVISSFCVFIYESAHPELPVTAPMVSASGERKFRDAKLHGISQCPQLVTFRLDGPLYFGSVEHVERKLKKMRQENPKQIHMILYLKGVGKIDLAGADLLIDTIREVKSKGGSFRIVALFPPLINKLRVLHVIDELGEDKLFSSKGEAVADATKDLNRNICKVCLKDVFKECDSIRDEAN